MSKTSTGQSVINISLPPALLKEIDRRAESLELPRSRYLAAIAQQDIAKGGPVLISQPTTPIPLTDKAIAFLNVAMPVLTQYQESRGQSPEPEVPEDMDEDELWEFFLQQRGHILDKKWTDSEKAGHDIGIERAIRDWLQKHHTLWAPAE